MKKRIALFLCLLLSVSMLLIACGHQNEDLNLSTTAPAGSGTSQSGGSTDNPRNNFKPGESKPDNSASADAPVIPDDCFEPEGCYLLYGTWSTQLDDQQIRWIFVNNGDFAQAVLKRGSLPG